MTEELDNIASELTPTDNTQTAEQNTAETKTEETNPDAPVNTDNAKPSRASKYDTLNKSYSELRSSYDRKNQEYSKKIQELEKRLTGYAPYEQYLPELQKALQEKKQQELAQQYQQNPLQTQQQLMEQMLNERLQPFQQQQIQQQNEQTVNQNIDWMKTTYGEEAFKEVSPIMGNILENVRQQQGEQVADILARNPEHLFNTAFGYLALQKIKEFNQNKQAGTQNKQQLAQVSAGISKPNRISKTTTSNNDRGSIEKAAFDYLQQNS